MRYETLTFGEVQELIQWCHNNQPYNMVFPNIGSALLSSYNTAAKKTHSAKLDHQKLSSTEMLRLKFFGLDVLLVDWKRWHGIGRIVDIQK